MEKNKYEFLNNGDVFTDGTEKVDAYTSTENLKYIGRIDSDGDFHFTDDIPYDEKKIDAMKKELRNLIATTHPDEWTPAAELKIFCGV